MDGKIEVGVDSRDVHSMTGEHDAIATGFARTREQPTLVGGVSLPRTSYDHCTCLRPPAHDDAESVDEVLVALQATHCPEEALRGVHVGDEANQRHTRRQPELATEHASLAVSEVVNIGAVEGEKDPVCRNATPAVLVACPAAAADPRVTRSARRQIETAEGRVLQVERPGYLEKARHWMV